MNRFFRKQSPAKESTNTANAPTDDHQAEKSSEKPASLAQNGTGHYALNTTENTPDGLTLKDATPDGLTLKDATPEGLTLKDATPETLTRKDATPDALTLKNATSETLALKPATATEASLTETISTPATSHVLVPMAGQPAIAAPTTAFGTNGARANGQALIQLNNVIKAYQTPVGEFVALRGINLSIGRGEFVAVVGKSGSGKSTLINMITGIDRPTSGEIFIDKTPIHNLAEGPMAEWRGRNVGIIFQFFQLLPMLSCIENVMLPMDFCNMFKPSERESRALHLLEQVDMVDHAYKLPSEVSGGQQQRVAIARALANDPPLLVADEPTGNLDSRTADAVFHLFERMVNAGKTILMVTHDDEMAHQVRRTITIADGQIVNQDYHTAGATPPSETKTDGTQINRQESVVDTAVANA